MKLKFKGFTLIELVVVIAIVGVLAAMLIPSMIGYVRKAKKVSDLASAKVIYQDCVSVITENDAAWDAVLNMWDYHQPREKWTAIDPYTHESYKLVAIARMSGGKKYNKEYTWTSPHPTEGEAFTNALTNFEMLDKDKSQKERKINTPLKLNADIPGTKKGKVDFWTLCYRRDTDEIEVWGSSSDLSWNSTTKGYCVYRLWPDPDPAYK